MRIKTFYAQTMAEALRDIKAELGPDALLLSTKEKPCRSGIASTVEVVAAVDGREGSEFYGGPAERPRVADARTSAGADELDGAPSDGAPVLYTPASMRKAPAPADPERPAARQRTSAAAVLYRDLVTAGVHGWLARRLVQQSVRMLDGRQRHHRPSLVTAVNSVAGGLIARTSDEGLPHKRIVAFIGPTGVGKTTTIAKLAARLALQMKRNVVLVTLDGYRIGAVDQLRTYASLIGVPFRFVRDLAGLQGGRGGAVPARLCSVDTTGRGPRDSAAIGALACLADGALDMERHLVLSATTRATDLEEIVERFAPCRPDHLLFTKLDETATCGPVFNELVRTGMPLSYYTNGQRVPEDIHVLPKERILDIVLNEV